MMMSSNNLIGMIICVRVAFIYEQHWRGEAMTPRHQKEAKSADGVRFCLRVTVKPLFSHDETWLREIAPYFLG